MAKQFPEPFEKKHQPDGDEPGYIKSSEGLAGHMDHDSRMPHPFKTPVVPMPSKKHGM